MRTFTPELDAGVLRRLTTYALEFGPDFVRKDQARWTEAYLRGLIQEGERKSVEPLIQRVDLPPQCRSVDPTQAVQHWLNQGKWDSGLLLMRFRKLMAEVFSSEDGRFIIDDTTFLKKGNHSVGVQSQYSGLLGRNANCQMTVSIHYSSPQGHFPLDLRLYLPQAWTRDQKRLDKARVPPEHRQHLSRLKIPLSSWTG